jgi:hypothetical protein
MNRYAIERATAEIIELTALDDDDPPLRAFRVCGDIAERYYRARQMWEQAQTSLRMLMDGTAPSAEGQRESAGEQR